MILALRGLGYVVALALGAVSLYLIVTSKTQKHLELGVLAGVWGAALIWFTTVFAPKPTGAGSTPPGTALDVRDSAQLVRVDEELRQFKAQLEQLVRTELRAGMARELAGLKAEVEELRTELVEKVGGQLRLERIETTRLIGSDLEALQNELRQLKVRQLAVSQTGAIVGAEAEELRPKPPAPAVSAAAHTPSMSATPAAPPPAAPPPAAPPATPPTAAPPVTPPVVRVDPPIPVATPAVALVQPDAPRPPAASPPPVSTGPTTAVPTSPVSTPAASATSAAPSSTSSAWSTVRTNAPAAPSAAPSIPPTAPSTVPSTVPTTASTSGLNADPLAGLPRLRPFTDLEPEIRPEAPGTAGTHTRNGTPVSPSVVNGSGAGAGRHASRPPGSPAPTPGGGRRHRADDSDNDTLARILQRESNPDR